jgi:DNA-binding NarL/FixJ family response regulator
MAIITLYTDRHVLALGLEQVIGPTHRLVKAGLESLGSGVAALGDVAILDGASGGAILRLRRENRQIAIVAWERSDASEPALSALSSGAQGVILDTSGPADVLACIETVLRGIAWVPPAIAQAAVSTRQCKLTRREGELLSLVATGLSNKEIAYSLGIAVGTVKVYLCRLFTKLGVSDRYELALLALRQASGRTAAAGVGTQTVRAAAPEPVSLNSVFVPRRMEDWQSLPLGR